MENFYLKRFVALRLRKMWIINYDIPIMYAEQLFLSFRLIGIFPEFYQKICLYIWQETFLCATWYEEMKMNFMKNMWHEYIRFTIIDKWHKIEWYGGEVWGGDYIMFYPYNKRTAQWTHKGNKVALEHMNI